MHKIGVFGKIVPSGLAMTQSAYDLLRDNLI